MSEPFPGKAKANPKAGALARVFGVGGLEPFLGTIRAFAFDFAPRGWARCDGSLLPINDNQALFSLLGTTYGGDGRTTFGLPDLRGRDSLHFGSGPGLTPRTIGQKSGAEDVTLTPNEIPSHTHALGAVAESPVSSVPTAMNLASELHFITASTETVLGMSSIGVTGGSPHNNMQPYLVINWCIALSGTFPSRN